MFEYETKSTSNGKEEILNEAKFYLHAYSDKFEKGNDYNEEKNFFEGYDGTKKFIINYTSMHVTVNHKKKMRINVTLIPKDFKTVIQIVH